MIRRILLVLGVVLAPVIAGAQQATPPDQAPPTQAAQPVKILDAVVVASYPHDPRAYTQGLLWHEGWLYESTGRIGQSTIRKVELATGAVESRRAIPASQFGEGLALWNDELISLTWRDGVVHRWRLSDLSAAGSHSDYPYEGWGLARFEDHLVASDGSSTLRFLDPQDYSVQRSVSVTFRGRPLAQLNELEVVNGMILANVWQTDFIVTIDPASGEVRAVIDCRGLPDHANGDRDAVLNGIAWDAEGKRLFVTGKLWPKLYQIELRERTPSR